MMGEKIVSEKKYLLLRNVKLNISSGRLDFIRGNLNWQDGEYFVSPTGFQGSGVLKSMVQANSLIVIPENLINSCRN